MKILQIFGVTPTGESDISYNGWRVSEVCGAKAEQILVERVQRSEPDTRLLYAPTTEGRRVQRGEGATATEESKAKGNILRTPVLSMEK